MTPKKLGLCTSTAAVSSVTCASSACEIDAAGLAIVANQRRRQILMLGVGGQHFAVLGMHG